MVTLATASTPEKELVETGSFARHETFHLRDGWLHKGLEILEKDSEGLYAPGVHHDIGVGVNMLKSLIYWLRATGLVTTTTEKKKTKPPLKLTEFGELVWQKDRYFEDIGTLWALHFELASNKEIATFWYCAFNEIGLGDINDDRLIQRIRPVLADELNSKIKDSSLAKDARCFMRTYVPIRNAKSGAFEEDTFNSPLNALDLIRESGLSGTYRLHVGEKRNLPLRLFAYALYRFRERVSPNSIQLSLDDLRWRPTSPGRLCGLDGHSLLTSLEALQHETSYAEVTHTTGVSTVALNRTEDTDPLAMLREYYEEQGA